jgi:hypothetical protein
MPPTTDDQLLEEAANLARVSLRSFTATPDQLDPFGAALVAWEVTGPGHGTFYRLKLNGSFVPPRNERVVQPKTTTNYRLTAVSGSSIRALGNVTVDVDLSRCDMFQIPSAQNTIEGVLRSGVEAEEDIYFRTVLRTMNGQITPVTSSPEVTFSPGRIRFKLVLGKEVNNFPNPSIDIDVSFGLDVQDGDVVSSGEDIDIDVSVPFWAWALPGAIPGLALAIAAGKDSARRSMRNAIAGIAQLLNLLSQPARGFRRHSVTIDGGTGSILIQQCPYEPLTGLVAVSVDARNRVARVREAGLEHRRSQEGDETK